MVDLSSGANHLIGRDRELAALESFLGAAAGGGATLLLAGEPGVGKTALLLAAAEMAAHDGVRVIHGGGVEYESDISFAGLHQLVDPLSDDLRRIPRTSRVALEVALGIGSGPAPDRLAVLNASLALFRQAASSSPLLIVVDDLHWLDRASGAVVGFVGRRLRGSRIGLLGAIRPGVGGFFERAGLPEFADRATRRRGGDGVADAPVRPPADPPPPARRRGGARQSAGLAGVRRIGRRPNATATTPPRRPDRAVSCERCTKRGSSGSLSRRVASSCSPR